MVQLADLLQRRLLFFTGKGGVGKTLSAGAFAQYAARKGKRVCLVQSGMCDQMSPLFGKPQSSPSPTDTIISENIHLMHLDTNINLRAFVQTQIGNDRIYRTFMDNKVMKVFLESVPGLEQVSFLGHVVYLAEQIEKYDIVIVDAYASGHFLSLISTPKAIADTQLGGKLIGLVNRVQSFLADSSNSAVVVVALPEPLVMSETIELLNNLKRAGAIHCSGVFLNRMLVESDQSVDERSNPWIREYIKNRMVEQQEAVGLLRDALRNDPEILYLPLADCGYVREPMAKNMADSLFHVHVTE